MPYMLRSRLVACVSSSLWVVGAMLVAMATGSSASAFDIKKVEASVYKVFATPKGSTGTGFLVSGRRTVITNFHVVENNAEFMIVYREGREVQVAAARVIGYKPGTGGTGGVSYLAKALELKFFPELWLVRTSM
jgi:tryptophan 2,3-dioxygenase